MTTGTINVVIDYSPRALQRWLHEKRQQHRFMVLVCHRRFGKTVFAVNELQRSALTVRHPRPRVALIGPTYRQEKAAAWDYMQHFSRDIPGVNVNQAELRVDYPNGGQGRLYGADNPDALRGIYLDDVGLDEYGLFPPRAFSEVISPTLVDRGGRAFFGGTPNGKNQFYEIAMKAQEAMAARDPNWLFASFPASKTGIIPAAELAAARDRMTEDEYAQEFECSFEAAVKGAIYVREIEAARVAGRITSVPYEPALPVDTDWDLGLGDATGVWFSQSTRGGEIRIIDYYEARGQGFPHYVEVLRQRGYVYGSHWAPHDIQVRELSSGRTRLEVAAAHGIVFRVVPRLHSAGPDELEEGIHAARLLFSRCWFDREKCKQGLEALQHYRRDYNTRLSEFRATPIHDWSSTAADAFRGLAVRHRIPADEAARRKAAVSRDWSWA